MDGEVEVFEQRVLEHPVGIAHRWIGVANGKELEAVVAQPRGAKAAAAIGIGIQLVTVTSTGRQPRHFDLGGVVHAG